jgi:hypothetical protein
MRMINNALWIPEPTVELQLSLCVEEALPLCRTQSVRSDAWRNQGVCGMDNDGNVSQGLCAELFSLCRNDYWRQIATPAGCAATRNQAQRDPALRLPVHWVFKRWEISVLLLLKDYLREYLWLVPCRTADAAATVDALMVCSVWCRAVMDIGQR